MKKLSEIQKEFQILNSLYNWKGINYPSKSDHWKKLKKTNPTIILNILYTKEKQIFLAHISKHNSTREKQMIFNNSKRRKRRMALSCS